MTFRAAQCPCYMFPADCFCHHSNQVCGWPHDANQFRVSSIAPSRRACIRRRQRTVRKRAEAPVARSTFDQAQLEDDTVALNSLQTSFADSEEQHEHHPNSRTDGHAASKHTAVLKASKHHKHPVQERQRPLGMPEQHLCNSE